MKLENTVVILLSTSAMGRVLSRLNPFYNTISSILPCHFHLKFQKWSLQMTSPPQAMPQSLFLISSAYVAPSTQNSVTANNCYYPSVNVSWTSRFKLHVGWHSESDISIKKVPNSTHGWKACPKIISDRGLLEADHSSSQENKKKDDFRADCPFNYMFIIFLSVNSYFTSNPPPPL